MIFELFVYKCFHYKLMKVLKHLPTLNRLESRLVLQTSAGDVIWGHPFKTSAFYRGGVKNWPNLPMDRSKKLPTGGGRGQKL